MRQPLAGIRVLDLSRVVSGPVVGRIFADMGADVVKVESPEGDITRLWGANIHGVPGFFLQQNAGKRGVCVDLRQPQAANVVLDLAEQADVLIENFRGGVMDRLGIGWPVLRSRNPRLVMLSITGFGQMGPEAHRPAYASIIQAESGLVARLAEADDRRPTDFITSIADYNSGLHGTIATLAAVLQARVTGVGDHIDLAMLDAMMATDDYLHHALDNAPMTRLGGEYYQTSDGLWTIVSGPINHVFRTIAASVGLADPAHAEDSATEKIQARRSALQTWAAGLTSRADLCAVLDDLSLPWGALKRPSEAALSPTVTHRRSIGSVADSPQTTRPVVQMPYRFAGSSTGVAHRSPHLGEHNDDVLSQWLGYSGDTISSLTRDGVLRAEPAPTSSETKQS
jgi:CoA:oxalate CoA-transferase